MGINKHSITIFNMQTLGRISEMKTEVKGMNQENPGVAELALGIDNLSMLLAAGDILAKDNKLEQTIQGFEAQLRAIREEKRS